ncbi:hypothetical protein [Hydrocarboniphaga sp.]|uniref:hypothetical protein n=1 Tax=Hydrocarboniphaga sp. TaxID=2033016 RepID=UPI003D0AE8B5
MKLPARWPLLLCIALPAIAAGLWWCLRAPAQHPDSARYLQREPALALVAGFVSYASIADTGALLRQQGHPWSRRTLARPPDPRYPPHVIDTMTVERFVMLGTAGRLSLQFFNDRLFEVDFKPDDAAACASALKRADTLLRRDRNGRAERVDGAWRLATNVELAASTVGKSLATEPYLLWQDLRLTAQRDDWDARFGALPYRLP